eukprot:GHVQ01003101.1.p1 GENE.GHVQ01003101.1~~GHVQ01003101.1.p1  ORF type:complete len:141 (-),score=11.83 GHVQ01003101.1:448-870(-)
MEKAGKLPEEFFNETDKSLIEQLKKGNTAIPDAVTTYHLQRVGCTTSDPTVVRLLSLVSQVALEKVLDDARIIATFKASATGSPQTPTTDDIVVDAQSLCDSFANNGENVVAPSLDMFLECPKSSNSSWKSDHIVSKTES